MGTAPASSAGSQTRPIDDPTIRAALRQRLLRQPSTRLDTILIEELGLCAGRVRVDIAAVNGHLHGFEIKSDRDSFRRLDGQVCIYSKVLDYATLVVGDRLLATAPTHVPAWWGVLHAKSVPGGLRFRAVRRGRRNPSRDPRTLAELLWADQALALLEQRGAARGVRGKPRRMLWDRVCETFDIAEIADAVRASLKARPARPNPA